MKFDIKLNGKKYIVEIGNSKAMILEKNKILESQEDDVTDIDVPDFDFSKKDDGNSLISAPLPGTVIAVSVKSGDQVTKGQTLIVLESMKMENEIVSPMDGEIDDILVSVGSSVKKSRTYLFKSVGIGGIKVKNLIPSLYVLETTDFNISNDILDMLPTERQIRINKAIKIEKAKQLYASSLLLGYILDKYGKKFDDIKLLESGKPYIKDGPYFNISHSGKYVVIAVDLEDIGIDIQEKTIVSEAAAKMFLGDDRDLNIALRNEYCHSYIWCRKEAFLKCLGVGWNGKKESKVSILCNKIEYNASSYFLTDYFISKDYFLTLCEKNEHKDFAIEEVSKLELEIFYRSG